MERKEARESSVFIEKMWLGNRGERVYRCEETGVAVKKCGPLVELLRLGLTVVGEEAREERVKIWPDIRWKGESSLLLRLVKIGPWAEIA
jgi:hypothetical protein